MRNDEFDSRVREFFAGAPRPPAPVALGRMPAQPLTAPARERVRLGGGLGARWPASVVMACLTVAVVVLALGSRVAGPAGSPASSLPSAAPVAVGSPYALDGLTWQEVGIGAFDGVGGLSLFPIDQGLLVVGYCSPGQVRLWFTSDGMQFEPLDASAFATEDPAAQVIFVNSLVKGPAGYVAGGTLVKVGNLGSGLQDTPVFWRSTDGLRWDRLSTNELPGEMVSSLAATSGGYVVALGPTETNGTTTFFHSYFSTDGASWQPGPVLAKVVGHDGHIVGITSDSAIAVSDDGKTWTTLHPAKQVENVVASPQGFLGITSDPGTTQMSVMRSTDGRNWTSVGVTSADWSGGMVYALGRWVMVGDSPSGAAASNPVLTSPDGVTWKSSAIPYQVLQHSTPITPLGDLYPFQDGFFAQNSVLDLQEPGGGSGRLHVWWVRESRPGDVPGLTAPPEASSTPSAVRLNGASTVK